MLSPFFHAWERRLADVAKDRIVRPFDWGLDWLPPNGHPPATTKEDLAEYVRGVLADTDAFFTPDATDEYVFADETDGSARLTFPSALPTPHAENNTVHAGFYPARASGSRGRSRRAVLLLPQWNSDAEGHVGLARMLAWFGMSALRLSLPYHDRRMPPELQRADYIVSSNVARTLQICRQAVLDARRAVHWLAQRGYERIGILGTSLGSCLSMLTAAHEPLIRVQALNHISPYFADVVWRGLSTRHVRAGLEGHITLDELRDLWMPISPQFYLDRIRDRQTLLVYARYDLTFPIDLSKKLVRAFADRQVPHRLATLPCGHYTTGVAPFKYMDGLLLVRFLERHL
jgi:Alpha/beta hydrolase domain containing 18